MVQKIAWKILREGKHKQVSGVLDFLTRNIADVAQNTRRRSAQSMETRTGSVRKNK